MHSAWILSLIAIASAKKIEPYGWSCYTLASRMQWPECSGLSEPALKKCLCEQPLFVSITTECLTRAVANASDPYEAFNKGYATLCHKEPEIAELTKIVPANDLKNGVDTAKSKLKNASTTQNLGLILMSYWLAICLLRMVYVAMSSLSPKLLQRIRKNYIVRKLKSRVLYPAIVGREQGNFFRLWITRITIPLRWTTIVIFGFVFLNLICLFVSFPMVNQSILFRTQSMQFKHILGYRSGCLSVFLMPLLILFGGRNNVFVPWTRWSLGAFTLFHKWIARIMFLNIAVHAICFSLLRAEQGLYPGVFRKQYWVWGAVAIASLSVIILLSLNVFRKRYYELFLVLHITLATIFLVGSWYHVYTLEYGLKHVIATVVIWGTDRVFRFVRMILLSPGTAVVRHNEHLTCLLIDNPGQWIPQPGSHIFVHFPALKFWQSHPFTILPIPDGGIKLCVLRKDGLTDQLTKLKGDRVKVWIDGPYGHHLSYKGHDEVVFIAGGVGITLALGLIHGLLNRKEEYKITLYWAVPFNDYLEFFTEDIQRALPDISVEIFVTREPASDPEKEVKQLLINYGSMDIHKIISRHTSPDSPTAITVCGPTRMNDQVRNETCNALENGALVTFTEDLFSF